MHGAAELFAYFVEYSAYTRMKNKTRQHILSYSTVIR